MRQLLHSLIALGAIGFTTLVFGQEPPQNDPNRDITPPAPTTTRDNMDRTTTPRTTTTTDKTVDDGFNPGWLGLIGLIGLAGLIPRDRREHHPVSTHSGTTHTGGTGAHRAT